jgi:hypothetical protein
MSDSDKESINILNSLISPDGTKPKSSSQKSSSRATSMPTLAESEHQQKPTESSIPTETTPKKTESDIEKLANIHLSVPGGCPFMSGKQSGKHSIHKNPEWQTSVIIILLFKSIKYRNF